MSKASRIWLPLAILLLGIILRLNAQQLAWPREYSYSGARSETEWARKEDAYAQVALVLMCVGGGALIVTYAHSLFSKVDK